MRTYDHLGRGVFHTNQKKKIINEEFYILKKSMESQNKNTLNNDLICYL